MTLAETIQPVLDKRLPAALLAAFLLPATCPRESRRAVNNWDDQICPDRENH